MRIAFAGDVFLGGDLNLKSARGSIKHPAFINADLRVINLEQPISDNTTVEEKCTLFTGSYALKQLQELKINCVNLAHNHIQDKGPEGIAETIKHLKTSNIGCFGAGANLSEARQPFYLTKKLVLLGYCEFDKPYLRQIVLATAEKPGVAPLRHEEIIRDLNSLPTDVKAVLYFHWGREHVWLPPRKDIDLAKKLLAHEKVVTIIGMHAHRPQGYITKNGKRAYMCLGNFLFPNFYLKPPTQLAEPTFRERGKTIQTTRHYHIVSKLTQKKWRLVNRTSLVVELDTETLETHHHIALQADNIPNVYLPGGFFVSIVRLLILTLSMLYKLPAFFYAPLEKLNYFFFFIYWHSYNRFFRYRQMGWPTFFKRLLRLSSS